MRVGLSQLRSLATRFARDDSGATAIEYAFIAAGISVTITVAVYALGTTLSEGFFAKFSDFFNDQDVG